MKLSNFTKLAGASVLTLSLTVLSLGAPRLAQDATATDDTTTTTETEVEGDRDFDWGWLGLLGLIGLAGLARKNEEPATRYREPDEASRPSTRY
ncbi:MAG: WGxxGxxG-CTERM domain-containing protein [Leptolyngbyaceae cyanobacterium RM2_2_4]|nr:WGxxGxxG-CTERM domain-containing protein [Leptolyngbyaceae cyanobacterium RM2_2_4]